MLVTGPTEILLLDLGNVESKIIANGKAVVPTNGQSKLIKNGSFS